MNGGLPNIGCSNDDGPVVIMTQPASRRSRDNPNGTYGLDLLVCGFSMTPVRGLPRRRPAEAVALQQRATVGAEPLGLLVGLHAFGDRLHIQSL